jgi:hypothetical protein
MESRTADVNLVGKFESKGPFIRPRKYIKRGSY